MRCSPPLNKSTITCYQSSYFHLIQVDRCLQEKQAIHFCQCQAGHSLNPYATACPGHRSPSPTSAGPNNKAGLSAGPFRNIGSGSGRKSLPAGREPVSKVVPQGLGFSRSICNVFRPAYIKKQKAIEYLSLI